MSLKNPLCLHNEIMNLPSDPDKAAADYGDQRRAYLSGHRDARHAAAELSVAYDRVVEALNPEPMRDLLLECRERVDALRIIHPIDRMPAHAALLKRIDDTLRNLEMAL